MRRAVCLLVGSIATLGWQAEDRAMELAVLRRQREEGLLHWDEKPAPIARDIGFFLRPHLAPGKGRTPHGLG